MNITRRYIEPVQPHADANIRPHYAVEAAAWVWHPDATTPAPAASPEVFHFTRSWALDEPCTLDVHVSADERYELSLNGEAFSAGPHRSDLGHWSFASFTLDLPAGDYTLHATAWRLGRWRRRRRFHTAGDLFSRANRCPS